MIGSSIADLAKGSQEVKVEVEHAESLRSVHGRICREPNREVKRVDVLQYTKTSATVSLAQVLRRIGFDHITAMKSYRSKRSHPASQKQPFEKKYLDAVNEGRGRVRH